MGGLKREIVEEIVEIKLGKNLGILLSHLIKQDKQGKLTSPSTLTLLIFLHPHLLHQTYLYQLHQLRKPTN